MDAQGTIFIKLLNIKETLFKEKPSLHLDNFINTIMKIIEIQSNNTNEKFWFNTTTDEWNKELYYQFTYLFIIVLYGSYLGAEDKTTKKIMSSCSAKDAVPEGMIIFHELHKDKHLQFFLQQFINSTFFKNKNNNSNKIKENLLKNILTFNDYTDNKEINDIITKYNQSKYFLIIRDLFISTRFQFYHEDVTIQKNFKDQFKGYPLLMKGMMNHYEKERIRGEILLKEKEEKKK